MSLRPDDNSAESDPLLLFETEPQAVAVPTPVVEIPKEIEPLQAPPDLQVLVRRAETAERALRESRREAAALKRQVATLVTAAADKSSRARRSAKTFGLAATCLLAVVAVGWQFIPAGVPPAVAAPAPAASAIDPEGPPPVAEVAVALAVPQTVVPADPGEWKEAESRTEYVGTLSVDAVPAGGEVFINRKSVGMAPVRVTGLRAGSHLVWISRDGYRRFTRVVLVPANQVSRVSVALEPEAGGAVRE